MHACSTARAQPRSWLCGSDSRRQVRFCQAKRQQHSNTAASVEQHGSIEIVQARGRQFPPGPAFAVGLAGEWCPAVTTDPQVSQAARAAALCTWSFGCCCIISITYQTLRTFIPRRPALVLPALPGSTSTPAAIGVAGHQCSYCQPTQTNTANKAEVRHTGPWKCLSSTVCGECGLNMAALVSESCAAVCQPSLPGEAAAAGLCASLTKQCTGPLCIQQTCWL